MDNLAEGKLTYVGSARLLDGIDVFNLTPEGTTLIGQVGDPVIRETIRDHLVNRQFRTDVFVKGVRALSPAEHKAAWQDQHFMIVTPIVDLLKRIRCLRGEVELPEEKYGLVIDAMASDHYRPKTITELMAEAALAHLFVSRCSPNSDGAFGSRLCRASPASVAGGPTAMLEAD